ncbi:hypothetical protein TPHA_0G03390 [Tetrapisispora phaffii CBS 4417]|uniref:Uncharacterized protein n=1 Tax=Tetrapisispora phaffii (strain ATCC 24235 / CBS 4417 / NBRC 1672 / NRRL Y-8282 / UCD 70-5) TaxID=1071381 RepID=G8BWA1_TETPH|nr:hypothetical protein TPHA_0G03390 [Tetrapisispora phaffii CBS 4417]CCE64179.1 hypothetical protein TPHA_0G03390 [Tetrapisispora phaffii CBS 4417]
MIVYPMLLSIILNFTGLVSFSQGRELGYSLPTDTSVPLGSDELTVDCVSELQNCLYNSFSKAYEFCDHCIKVSEVTLTDSGNYGCRGCAMKTMLDHCSEYNCIVGYDYNSLSTLLEEFQHSPDYATLNSLKSRTLKEQKIDGSLVYIRLDTHDIYRNMLPFEKEEIVRAFIKESASQDVRVSGGLGNVSAGGTKDYDEVPMHIKDINGGEPKYNEDEESDRKDNESVLNGDETDEENTDNQGEVGEDDWDDVDNVDDWDVTDGDKSVEDINVSTQEGNCTVIQSEKQCTNRVPTDLETETSRQVSIDEQTSIESSKNSNYGERTVNWSASSTEYEEQTVDHSSTDSNYDEVTPTPSSSKPDYNKETPLESQDYPHYPHYDEDIVTSSTNDPDYDEDIVTSTDNSYHDKEIVTNSTVATDYNKETPLKSQDYPDYDEDTLTSSIYNSYYDVVSSTSSSNDTDYNNLENERPEEGKQGEKSEEEAIYTITIRTTVYPQINNTTYIIKPNIDYLISKSTLTTWNPTTTTKTITNPCSNTILIQPTETSTTNCTKKYTTTTTRFSNIYITFTETDLSTEYTKLKVTKWKGDISTTTETDLAFTTRTILRKKTKTRAVTEIEEIAKTRQVCKIVVTENYTKTKTKTAVTTLTKQKTTTTTTPLLSTSTSTKTKSKVKVLTSTAVTSTTDTNLIKAYTTTTFTKTKYKKKRTYTTIVLPTTHVVVVITNTAVVSLLNDKPGRFKKGLRLKKRMENEPILNTSISNKKYCIDLHLLMNQRSCNHRQELPLK